MGVYNITLSVCSTVLIEAKSKEEAVEYIKNNFEEGKQDLIDSIDLNGFEIELNEDQGDI